MYCWVYGRFERPKKSNFTKHPFFETPCNAKSTREHSKSAVRRWEYRVAWHAVPHHTAMSYHAWHVLSLHAIPYHITSYHTIPTFRSNLWLKLLAFVLSRSNITRLDDWTLHTFFMLVFNFVFETKRIFWTYYRRHRCLHNTYFWISNISSISQFQSSY